MFAIGSFDYFFPDDGSGSVEGVSYDLSYFEVNANVAYPFVIEDSPLLPYVGGGLNLARISLDLDMPGASASESETELGLNLLGGSKFDIGAAVVPFLEFRVELSGGEQFVISGGILF